MNRIFGFFKQKLKQAKEQNQSQLQHILSALDFEAYSQARMLSLLQEVKTNYLEWNIMIANEASTGLYYTQLHFKNALGRYIRVRKETQGRQEKMQLVLGQMRKTLKELKGIEKLNYQWANTMSERVNALAEQPQKILQISGKVEYYGGPQQEEQMVRQSQQQQPITEVKEQQQDPQLSNETSRPLIAHRSSP